MSKRFHRSALAVLVIGSLAAWLVFQYTKSDAFWEDNPELKRQLTDEDLARTRAQLDGTTGEIVQAQPLPTLDPSAMVRLAIGGLGLLDDEQNKRVSELTLVHLTAAPGLEMVERQSLEAALRELRLSLSGLLRAQDAVRVGKLVRADWFLFGSATTTFGTNACVARIVDAKTGVVLDLTVLPTGGREPGVIAAELAQFVRRAREGTSVGFQRTFLAVGGFEDLSVNRRQAGFADDLKAFLVASFQNADVTLVERDLVSTLLQEVRLSLAGLSDSSEPPSRMQSAFWLVDGYYQSFEREGFEVELVLRMEKMLSGRSRRSLRGQPDESFYRNVKTVIEETLRSPEAEARLVTLMRRTEVSAQMDRGRDRSRLSEDELNPWRLQGRRGIVGGYSIDDNPQRRRQNLDEAIQAFETVLLLEPENAEAKLYLAACLLDPVVDQVDEARSYYREVMASPSQDHYKHLARLGLAYSYIYRDYRSKEREDPPRAVELFRAYAQETTDAVHRAQYEQGLAEALAKLMPTDPSSRAPILAHLEERLGERLQQLLETGRRGGRVPFQGEFNSLRNLWRTDGSTMDQELIELVHRLQGRFPELAPYIVARTLGFATHTNAPVVKEFREMLAVASEDPKSIFCPESYFSEILAGPWHWATKQQAHDLLVQIGNARLKAAQAACAPDLTDEQRVKLAFEHVALEQWKEALVHFDYFGRRVIDMSGNGPWGDYRHPFLPAQAAEHCREHLGLTVESEPDCFEAGRPWMELDHPFLFLPDGDSVWLAGNNVLACFDLATGNSWKVRVQTEAGLKFTCLAQSEGKLWAGTAGGGLVALNKADRSIQRITEDEGLLLNHVTALCPHAERLWIGYGRERLGGLGWMDLSTGKVRSLTPALPTAENEFRADIFGQPQDPPDGPPRGVVTAIAPGWEDELWVAVFRKGIQRYRINEDQWTTFPSSDEENELSCLVADSSVVVAGSARRLGPQGRVAGLTLLSGSASGPLYFNVTNGLPHRAVTSLALDGDTLWIGGRGFIALFDLKRRQVTKTCLVSAHSVDDMVVNGDQVWAKFNQAIYRFPRSLAKFK